MPFTVTLDDTSGILWVVLQGEMHLPEILLALEAATPGGQFSSARRLWDLRECTPLLATEDVRTIAATARRRDRPGSRIALLAGSDLSFGILRQNQVFREVPGNEVRVFRDVDEAVGWLAE
jgi:hypothetical protein